MNNGQLRFLKAIRIVFTYDLKWPTKPLNKGSRLPRRTGVDRKASFVVRSKTVRHGAQASTAKVRPDLRYGTGKAKHTAEERTAKTAKPSTLPRRKPSSTVDRRRRKGKQVKSYLIPHS
jgi:hypothetical protein